MASKSERTRTTILEAACRCIATLGIERSSITEIAKEAGVSRGLVAHYFPEKSRLFFHVIQWIAAQAYTSIEAPPSEAGPRERILHTAKSNFAFFSENAVYYKCFILFYYFASIDPEFREWNGQLMSRAMDRMRKDVGEFLGSQATAMQIEALSEALHRSTMSGILKRFIAPVSQGTDLHAEFLRPIEAILPSN